MRRSLALGAAVVVAAAALLRFAGLGTQSFWLDEAVTAGLVVAPLGGVLDGIAGHESTPPLYYLLAWLWVRLFGADEVGLRALSALLGTLTVMVAIAVGRRAGGGGAALVGGALVACSPLLVWYSQEARAYALFVLLASLSVLLMLRALERPSGGRLAAWGAVAALALCSHYFAVFLVAPQAAWLLVGLGWGRAGPATAAPAIAALALAPLALHQNANDTAAFIRASSLRVRAAQLGKQALIGYDAPAEKALAVVAALLVCIGLLLLLRATFVRRQRREIRVIAMLAGLTATAVGAPLVLAALGEDDVLTRNLLAALVPALCVLGAGYAAARAGLLAAAALCVVWLVAVVAVARDPVMQRDDWRGATGALGPARTGRAVVVTPASGLRAAELYLPGSRPLTARGAPLVREIDLVAIATRAPGEPRVPPRPATRAPPAPGFGLAERVAASTFTVYRYRAVRPVVLRPGVLDSRGLDGSAGAVVVQPPGPPG